MAYTYSKLASTTVGVGGTSAITFSNIPQNYTDLIIKISARSAYSGTLNWFDLKFNGSSIGWSGRFLYGTGSAAGSGTQAAFGGAMPAATATANTFGNAEIYIPNYTSSNYKSVSIDAVAENNATAAEQDFTAQLWSNVTAISSVTLFPELSSTFLQYTTATLYGVRVEL